MRVVLTAVTAQYQAAMASAGAATRGLGADIATIGKSSQVEGALKKFGLTTNMVMGGAVAGGLYGAAKAAMDFESSFAGVRKTVDGSDEELEALAQGMRDLSKEIPVNVNELNAIGEAAGQLGVQKKNILGFTAVMAKLGVTTNLTSDEAASSLARLANITQMPEDQFDRLGSTVVALGNAGASTEADIVSMGLRIAGAGHQVGLTEAEILAVSAALSDVGINAEAGGSAISKTMIEIAREVEMGGDKLALFAEVAGMSATEFSTAWRTDAAGALAAFIKGLGQMDKKGSSTLATLEALGITEVRMRDALLRSAGAGELLTDHLENANAAWSENSALNEEAAKRFETTESAVQLAKNAVNDLAITVGMALTPAIKSAAEGIADLSSGLMDIIDLGGDLFGSIPEDLRGIFPSGPFDFLKDFGEISSTDILTGGLSKVLPDAMTDWIPDIEFNPFDLIGDDADPEKVAAGLARIRNLTTGTSDAVGAAFAGAASSVDPLIEKIEGAETAYESLNRALTGASGFLDIESAAISVEGALLDYRDSQAAVNELVEDGKKGTREYKRALLDERSAQLGVVTAQASLEDALLSYTEKVETGEVKQREAIDAVRAFGAAGQLTKDQVNNLIDRIRSYDSVLEGLPGKKKTDIEAHGLDEAQRIVQQWKNALLGIPRNLTTTVSVHTLGAGVLGDKPLLNHAGGMAGGGARRLSGGLRSDEYPTILQRGELTFAKADVRALASLGSGHGGREVHNHYHFGNVLADDSTFRRFAEIVTLEQEKAGLRGDQ